MTLSVVVLLNHSVFILCESRFCNQVQNIFIVAATIYSMMADSSYWHYASLCERFLIQQWPSILLLWWKADDILLLWHYHSTTGWSFYENSWKTFLFVTMLRQHATHSRPFMVKVENLFIVQCEQSFYGTQSFFIDNLLSIYSSGWCKTNTVNSQTVHLFLLSRYVVAHKNFVIFMIQQWQCNELTIAKWWSFIHSIAKQSKQTNLTFNWQVLCNCIIFLQHHCQKSLTLHETAWCKPLLVLISWSTFTTQIFQTWALICPHLFSINFLVVPAEHIHKQCVFHQPHLWRQKYYKWDMETYKQDMETYKQDTETYKFVEAEVIQARCGNVISTSKMQRHHIHEWLMNLCLEWQCIKWR